MSVRAFRAFRAFVVVPVVLLAAACEPSSPTSPVDPVAVTTESLPEAVEGLSYGSKLEATGGGGGFTWLLAAGSLPGGLSLTPAGMITGTPVAPGTATFRVRATDGSGRSATADLSLSVVQALAVHTATLPHAVVGGAYTVPLFAVGGRGARTWAVTGGGASSWLGVSASGVLSGTPSTAGTTAITVSVSDESGQEAIRSLSVTVLDALAVVAVELPDGTQGRDYAAQLVASGGDGTYTWSMAGGGLPAGLQLGAGGALSGAPTDAGTFNFTARVTDGAGRTATRSFDLTVTPAPTIQTTGLPPADVGVPYAAALVATGGTGAYTWSVTSGALPAGLTLAADGSISGTATTPGSATFTVQVKDAAAAVHVRTFTLAVATIEELASGVAVGGLSGGTGSVRYFSIDVPAGAASLTIGISGGTGDADLYVRHAQLPLEFTYDCRPLRQGNEETCTRTQPSAGRWYVMVRGHVDYAGLSLLATVGG